MGRKRNPGLYKRNGVWQTQTDARKPYPISWEEQNKLFAELPQYLHDMVLFKVNTGCRAMEVCRLRWEWEITFEEHPDICLFLIPGRWVKNGRDRLVVCNEVAAEIIENQRGQHDTHVFHKVIFLTIV